MKILVAIKVVAMDLKETGATISTCHFQDLAPGLAKALGRELYQAPQKIETERVR